MSVRRGSLVRRETNCENDCLTQQLKKVGVCGALCFFMVTAIAYALWQKCSPNNNKGSDLTKAHIDPSKVTVKQPAVASCQNIYSQVFVCSFACMVGFALVAGCIYLPKIINFFREGGTSDRSQDDALRGVITGAGDVVAVTGDTSSHANGLQVEVVGSDSQNSASAERVLPQSEEVADRGIVGVAGDETLYTRSTGPNGTLDHIYL